jgi:hypothetical protein
VNSNGNIILNDSTFTWNNGQTGDIAGVSLAFSAGSAAGSTTSGSAVDQSLALLVQSIASFGAMTSSSALTANVASQAMATTLAASAAH